MINGIINVYKEKGYTSHDVIAKMRGILRIRKIGHTGTLDPDAVGVLPVCIGSATKLVDLITDKDKTYEAVLKLGLTTDTQDITGKILTTSRVTVNLSQIREAVECYMGEYMQLPPMYSAIKVNGQRLYDLARQGREIERERRRVIIKDIKILDYSEEAQEVRVLVDCGKGTYIRTLLHDIGQTLGCGGTMKSLVRTAVGGFSIEDSLKLSEIEKLSADGSLSEYVLPVDSIFHNYRKAMVDREFHKLIYNGNIFRMEHLSQQLPDITEELVRVYDADDNFIGIYRFEPEPDLFKPYKMFLSDNK